MISRQEFDASLAAAAPPGGLSTALASLWWEKKGDWPRAHALVNELSSPEAMAVHAHLHRREGDLANADYWYSRAGRAYFREDLEEEWLVLVDAFLAGKQASL
jgi:hypothetical protein